MDTKRFRTFSSTSWLLCFGGFMILFLFWTNPEEYWMDEDTTVCALIAMAGPLIAYIARSIALRRKDAPENVINYKSWRINTMVYFFMTIMACISFAMALEGAYETSSKHLFDYTAGIIVVLFLFWIGFLALNTACFLVAVKEHNNSSAVRTDDFQKSLADILREIDEMNGVRTAKETGKGILRSRKKEDETDGRA